MVKRLLGVVFAGAVLGTCAYAQVSSPGLGSGEPEHYNLAHKWIAIHAPLPGQVEFEIPQIEFQLDPRHIVPENALALHIRVRNNSDRAIIVSDDGLVSDSELDGLGFDISASPLTLPVGGEGWFTYNITMPTVDEINTIFQMAHDGLLPIVSGGGGYDPATGNLRAVTKLVAEGVIPPGDTSAEFGF